MFSKNIFDSPGSCSSTLIGYHAPSKVKGLTKQARITRAKILFSRPYSSSVKRPAAFHSKGSLKRLLVNSLNKDNKITNGPKKKNPCMLLHKICVKNKT